MSTEQGLHGKYIIHKRATGEPVKYPCFVLRIDGKDQAGMQALKAYALSTDCSQLREDLLRLISETEK